MPRIIRNIDNTSNILFQDDFNRANDTVGSNYQVASGSSPFLVVSNAVRGPDVVSVIQLNCVSTASLLFPADQEAQVSFAAVTSTGFDYAGPAVRVDPETATGYILRMDGFTTNRRICRINGTIAASIGNVNLPLLVGDVWTLRAVGNRISAYRNGILIDSVVDNTYTSGQPGLTYEWGNSRGTRMDNFIVRNVRNTFRFSSTGTRGRVIGRST